MRETLETPVFRAKYHHSHILVGLALLLLTGVLASGCVKRTIKMKVPNKILHAKTATLDELLNLIRSYNKIETLSSSLEVTYFSGKKESGVIQEIRKQPGYILLKRPNSVRLVVQNFVTKTRELDLLSVGDNLSIWIRRGNKLYLGKNSAKELTVKEEPNSPGFTVPIRGGHIFEALFPQSFRINAPKIRHSMIEESGQDAKYYILGFYTESGGPRIYTNRRIWIERSSLTIARQQIYLDEGQITSDITYSDEVLIDGFYLPLKIHIDRPLDGYALDMEFKSWRINPELADNAFVLTPPEGAQIIKFGENED
jgi:outer membrane lipoprotein-sorting protein